ncbi:hypothetical protein AALP_AA2G037300 [Arabis alpina]|uniref:Ubiquitin-like protease family profile domain-containing protein n=1 Tax=Arabis alpina TaxID=50452 RepID=A0A087HF58_ARAAL|nr:hypothetical protein AALP_AA2G037300 [Arabis alpina]
MIRDILGGCLDEDFWELNAPVSKKKKSRAKDDSPGSKKKKTKAKVEESEDEDEDDSPVEKKKKIKKSKKIKAKVVVEESEDEDDSLVEKKEKKKEKEKVKHGKRKIRSDTSGDEDSQEECDLDIPIKNIPKLKKKKETEAGGIGEVLKLLQGMVGTIANFDTRLTSLEGKGNASKAVVDEQSNTGVGGDASMEEDDLSWMEQQPTSKTKFPVNRVVRKPDVNAKPTEQRKGKSKPATPVQKVEAKKKTKDAIADAGKKKEISDSDFVTPPRPRKAMHYAYSSSSDDDDDVKEKQINDALDNALDLVSRSVKVYDSIISGYKDDVMAASCRPYTKMIPLLLKAAAPPEKRKGMSEVAFHFYRKKSNVPQNIQSGDCGVYTVKVLECLALGKTMNGLCDAIVGGIRLKLAVDILEEAPFVDLVQQVSDPNPRTNPDDKVRIRHLVVKPFEFIYPTWIDAEDLKLNNMIRDILGGCLDEDFWELNAPVSKKKKTKAKVEESEDEDEDDSPVEKKNKIKKSKKIKAKVLVKESEDEDDSPVEKKEKKKSKKSKAKVVVEESENEDDSPVGMKEKKKEKVKHGKRKIRSDTSGDEDSEEECDLDIPIKNIPKLKKKKETEAGDIGEVLKLLHGMADTIANFDTTLTSLEGKGNASKAVDNLELAEMHLWRRMIWYSWMEQQPTSKTKFPVNRVVRKPDVKAKPTNQRKGKSKPAAPVQKVEAKKKSKRIAFKEKEPTAAKRKEEGAECVEIHDLTKDAIGDAGKKKAISDSDFVTPPRKAMHYAYSSSSDDDDDDDVKAKQINDALDNALGAIAKLSKTDDLVVPPPIARNKTLAPSQRSPFIGHSRTIRIMGGTEASSVVYNPFEPVD